MAWRCQEFTCNFLGFFNIPRFEMPLELMESLAPHYTASYLGDQAPDEVFKILRDLDWAFTDDETQFLTHDLHPYPAKFIPQIPGNIITRLSQLGDTVLDPFGGSGTTALEAVRLGRRAISLDANPVAGLIGRVKTAKRDRARTAEINGFHAHIKAELQSGNLDPTYLLRNYREFIPEIPHREKWFPDTSCGELAMIKGRISALESAEARDVAYLALSRIALRVSYQDSETRYKSTPREIPSGKTLKEYIRELEEIRRALSETADSTQYGVVQFLSADIRSVSEEMLPSGCADLVVTSPPYGNANDYHLYHRFRILWLGFDPKQLASIEIGSHLKHQRENSGFASYLEDMRAALVTIHRALRPGRYAALVIGSSIYEGVHFDSSKEIQTLALGMGFDASTIINRDIHDTRRSFVPAARRARNESILFLRKAVKQMQVTLSPPPYRLWPYEETLRIREIGTLLGIKAPKQQAQADIRVNIASADYTTCRKLVFSHTVKATGGASEPTWQSILENGTALNPAARKDPKYVTHGLHPYKGKFYPQLAKGLINLIHPKTGATIFDPFCGSGTTLLEGYLNGLKGIGVDMNPVAALIARAKLSILDVAPEIVREACESMFDILSNPPASFPKDVSEFNPECLEEIERWFPKPVTQKLNWTLRQIRKISSGSVQDFLVATLSSIIRDVSQQDPSDLRIRYRATPIKDADVFGLFRGALETQYGRVVKFWRIRGYSPYQFIPATVCLGDSRDFSALTKIGLADESVDLILTSPPYATALPYIDTDRLSLLTLLGLPSSERRPIEYNLIGSREITASDRKSLRQPSKDRLPEEIETFVTNLERSIGKRNDAGFRKQNMPALLVRFFQDIHKVLFNAHRVAKPGSPAMIVIGDNTTELGGDKIRIPTTDFVAAIARDIGFAEDERVDISVTTENLVHIKNSITENVVLCLRKAS